MTTRISIDGELDAARIESLRKTLDELAASNSDLTIDMKNCTFLDSSGVGAIVFITSANLHAAI